MTMSFYVASLRADGVGGQVLPIQDWDIRENDEKRGKPAEDLIPIPLVPEDPEKVTFIGESLEEPLRGKLVKFLQENSDCFAFQAEYEALIAGLSLEGTLRVKKMKVCGDSKLVISQVKGEFEARDETMAIYVRLVRTVMTQFDECHVKHIPREENGKAYALSKFASSEIEKSSGSVYFRILKTRSLDVKLVAPIGLGT
ncbi:uncharacterized protein LOC141665755 [Apium graveolens]|uniref:uncharacterized protein LOC141665755 n=1 Tax=Apium graveolens TaxID=4045 RepID=UPI003D7950DB